MSYEKWSLGYWCLKQYVKFADWIILKKTIITGKEKIPVNKPLVFAPNHQNALSDPLAILLNIPFQPVWLARADLFTKSKAVNACLKFIKIMPVFRLRDGKENLEKNELTFTGSIRVLENNSALALFPEAAHSAKRQMLAHKKAVARIVFMAEEKSGNKLDIQIIPTGIYYSHYWKFNRTVIVNYGDPIRVQDFLDLYSNNPVTAANMLKNKIYESILPLVINISSKKYYNAFECIRKLYGEHFLKQQNQKYSELNLFKSDQLLVSQLDKMENTQPEEVVILAEQATDLQQKIKNLDLRNWLVNDNKNHLIKIGANTFLLLAGLPVFIYGFLFNSIPFFLTDRLIRKKVKDKSFWSTFFLATGIVVFPIFYLIILIILLISGLLPWIWLKIIFLVSLPFSGKLAFKWFIILRKTMGRCNWIKIKWFKPAVYQQLLMEKEKLFKELDRLLLSK